jgi:hypothetical protein
MIIEEILSRLQAVTKSGDGWSAKCPAHDDGHASLSVSQGEESRILLHCHAGCDLESVCAALGIHPADLFPSRPSGNGGRQIVATYPYSDENGTLLFQVVRLEPKDFRQRRPNPAKPGAWFWNMQGVKRVLYRLPAVLNAVELGETVFLTEGEKDADNLAALGFCATCNAGGALKWQDSYTTTLTGAEAVIICDKDVPGRAHGQLVASELLPVAKSVKVIELPDRNGARVKDASDWLAAGGTPEELRAIVASAPGWTPAPKAQGTPVEATLAAAATDGCSQQRKLYTNSDIVTLRARAWLAITSANPTFGADSGLADRLLVVRMDRRDGEETSDAELTAEILAHRDAGLSHIAMTLQMALADKRQIPAGLNARHPDFAAFAIRIGRALGRETEAIAALQAAEADKSAFCLENDNVASALLVFLRQAGSFHGTAVELLPKLIDVDKELEGRLSAKSLGKRLSALWPHISKHIPHAIKELDRTGITVFDFRAT